MPLSLQLQWKAVRRMGFEMLLQIVVMSINGCYINPRSKGCCANHVVSIKAQSIEQGLLCQSRLVN